MFNMSLSYQIGLACLLIIILIIAMIISVSVIGVCLCNWLGEESENGRRESERQRNSNSAQSSCQYDHQNRSVRHVVVLPEKLKGGITMDPCQLREHFHRVEEENSRRYPCEGSRSLQNELSISIPSQPLDEPPPPYDALYPSTSTFRDEPK